MYWFTFYTKWSLAAPTAPVKSPYFDIATGMLIRC